MVCVDPTSNTTVDLGTASATINLASNETVTCTFTDSKAYNQNLTVSKTATPSYGRSYSWDIYKNVDKTQANIAEGGEATFKYTVAVTHDSGTDSGFTVSGVITVSNPNSFAIAGVDISDAIDNGGTCSVTDGEDVTVPANGNVNRNYSCSFSSNPGTGTNTATATWDANAYFTPSGTANGTAGYNFASATPAISNGTVNVTDTLGGNLGSVSYTDPSPVEFTYSKTFPGVAGTCTDYDNTATITETGQSASQTVTVCVGKDLTVSETMKAEYGLEVIFEMSPFLAARWVSAANRADLEAFVQKSTAQLAEDVDGAPVYLGKSAWEIGYVQEKNPAIRFSASQERAA